MRAEIGIREMLLAVPMSVLLQRQCLVEHEPARAAEPTHQPDLGTIRSKHKFEGFPQLHSLTIRSKQEQRKADFIVRRSLSPL